MPENPTTTPSAGKRILLIEPSPSVRGVLEFALRAQGQHVISVPDAGEGLRQLSALGSDAPDLVILALQRGSLHERDLLNTQAYGRLYRHVALILLTTPEHRLNLPSYLAARAIYRLDKPFTVPQITQLMYALSVGAAPERRERDGSRAF